MSSTMESVDLSKDYVRPGQTTVSRSADGAACLLTLRLMYVAPDDLTLTVTRLDMPLAVRAATVYRPG